MCLLCLPSTLGILRSIIAAGRSCRDLKFSRVMQPAFVAFASHASYTKLH